MADPVSISGTVVGVVSLGLTACRGLIAYYGPWKSYDEDISNFTTRLEGLQDILQELDGFVSAEQELDLSTDQYRRRVSLRLASCQKACDRLKEALEKCKSSDTSPFLRKHDWLRLKRAVYPFKKETLVMLSQTVSGLQEDLQLSLQLLNSAVLAEAQKEMRNLKTAVTSIYAQTTSILTIAQQNITTATTERARVCKYATIVTSIRSSNR